MKVIHFLLGLVLYLALAAGALAVIVSPQYPDFIQSAVAWGSDLPDWAKVALGVGGILYLFVYLVTGLRWVRGDFITFENANGTVSVSTGALQDYLNGLKTEFAAVAWIKSRLRAVRGALEVDLAEGSLADVDYLYSQDAKDWQPLPEDLEANPVDLNFLWLVFPDDGSAAAPEVIEIRPNP